MKIKNTEIKIIKGDLTDLSVDAIVNAANTQLILGGGLAGVIKKKGGESIEKEAVKKGPIKAGEAVATKAGQLKSKFIIHAATVKLGESTNQVILRNSVGSALKCAEELKVQSLAFPALGCGVGGFPLIGAAKIMIQEVMKHLRRPQVSLREITFCLFDEETFQIFDKQVRGYVKHIQETLGAGPYPTVDIIIELKEGIILIERSNPPFGWALPGGFVDYGESLETAAIREAKEETNVDLVNVRQFHTYSTPDRDPRFHTISTVFVAKGKGKPQFGDDAKGLTIIKYEDLLKREYAFDHKDVIKDYLKSRKKNNIVGRRD